MDFVSVLIAIYTVIEQIININKNYRRTIKGKKLLNKAYALKNYLKQYSLIKTRTEKELVLWEYYLVYAVLLDVNVNLEDKIIEKYVKNIVWIENANETDSLAFLYCKISLNVVKYKQN